MGEFDEGTTSEPVGGPAEPTTAGPTSAPEPAIDSPIVPIVPVAPTDGPVAPAEQPAVWAPQPVAPAEEPPAAVEPEESGAELIARLAAELAVVGGGASAQEQGTDVAPDANAVEASAQEQLELEVPAIESPVEPAEQPLGAEVGPAADVPAEPEGAADDIEAAIAAANEQIGVASTLDDIVPGTTQGEEGAEESENLAPRFGAPWWPFLVYLVLWLAFAGLGIWQLNQLPAGQVAYETQPYMLFLFGGIIMAAVGPILILAVWLATWLRARRMRTGLFTSALVKGAIVTVIGVAIWWGSFMALDYLRLGRTF